MLKNRPEDIQTVRRIIEELAERTPSLRRLLAYDAEFLASVRMIAQHMPLVLAAQRDHAVPEEVATEVARDVIETMIRRQMANFEQYDRFTRSRAPLPEVLVGAVDGPPQLMEVPC